jgi:hypothetical protein
MASAGEHQPNLRVPLEPVDRLEITALVDNTYDVFMPDQGPAHRGCPRRRCSVVTCPIS